jgi:fucose 4-O-acetylase-like acetyltransferase
MRRSAGPDQLKAILLTFVIFGHTFVQPESGDLGKWLIYGFHMPAFLFLSGYLLAVDRLVARPWREFLAHYWRRMLAAWLVVSALYLAVFDPSAYAMAPHALRTFLLTPVWHLWYVPALFLAVAAAKLLAGSTAGRLTLGAVALLGMIAFETPLGHAVVPSVVQAHVDHRYLGYFGWFLLGLAVRNGWVRVPAAGWRIAAIVVGAAGWVAGFYGHEWAGDVGFVVLNVGAVLSVPTVLGWLAEPVPVLGGALTRIGRYSLWVYLLHPFVTGPLQASADRPGAEQRVLGLLVTAAILVTAAAATWAMDRRRQATVAEPAPLGNL